MTQTSKKQLPNIEAPRWGKWLALGCIFGFIGGFLIAANPPRCYYGCIYSPLYFLGYLAFVPAFIFDLLCIRDLIAEANIKALEVFHGQKRTIVSDLWTEPLPTPTVPKQPKNKKTKRPTYTIDDDIL